MNLDGLRCLVRLVKLGSISGTARDLGVSRSTVRRRLQELEEALGLKLFTRKEGGTIPTAAAFEVAQRGHVILAEVDEILALTAEDASGSRSVVRVLAPTGMHPNAVRLALASCRTLWPALRVHLHEDDDPYSRMDESFDIVLCINRRRPTSDFWEIIDLPPVREGFFATTTYLERSDPIEEIADLANHELIVWHPPDVDPLLLPSPNGDLPIAPTLVTTNLHHAHSLVDQGIGIGYGVWGLPFEQPSSPLRGVLNHIGRERLPRLLVRPSLLRSPKVKAVVTAVKAAIEGHPTGSTD